MKRLHQLLLIAVLAAAANVIFLAAHGGSYDLHMALLHSENAFKPLLILNGIFLLTVLAAAPRDTPRPVDSRPLIAILVVLASAALASTFNINALDDDWNYRFYSSTHDSFSGLVHLFTASQFGQWYRPVGFVSLWLDYALFHQHVWAYHFQQVLLHFANAFLVFRLARRLGLSETAARWSGTLYLTAAIAFEPVLWPAARFDLWAMFFILAALLLSAKVLTGSDRATLMAALVCYALAVASKESAYAFPILVTILAATSESPRRRDLIQLAVGVLLITGAMLTLRHAVLGGVGGYASSSTAPSPNFSFSLATIRILLARVAPISMLAVNLNNPTPGIMLAVIAAFALLLAVAALAGASTRRRDRLMVWYVFAATLPAAPLIGWIDFKAMHVRYLYMPAAFVMMLAAAALSNARRAGLVLFAFAALNLACGFYDTWAYRITLDHSRDLARGIERDLSGKLTPVEILGMPREYNGVLFSRTELEYQLEAMVPGVRIAFQDKGPCTEPLCYTWQPERRTLERSPITAAPVGLAR